MLQDTAIIGHVARDFKTHFNIFLDTIEQYLVRLLNMNRMVYKCLAATFDEMI